MFRIFRSRAVGFAPVRPHERLHEVENRTMSDAHHRLLDSCTASPPESWSGRALCACIGHLATSTATEARSVYIEAATTIDENTFQMLFRTPYVEGLVGVRLSRSTKLDRDLFPYPMEGEITPDPAGFGRNVADFAVGEPFGAESLDPSPDSNGVYWMLPSVFVG
jgi:hypothetical protein